MVSLAENASLISNEILFTFSFICGIALIAFLARISAYLPFKRLITANKDLRSTSVNNVPLRVLPIIVSPSQSLIRFRRPITAGRSLILTLFLILPRRS